MKLLIALVYIGIGVVGFVQVVKMDGAQTILAMCTGTTAGYGVGTAIAALIDVSE